MFVVNGCAYRVDVNFVSELFYDEIEGERILIGTYPQSETDVVTMQQEEVGAVVCV